VPQWPGLGDAEPRADVVSRPPELSHLPLRAYTYEVREIRTAPLPRQVD
jgi:hypothetical protein